MNSVMSGGLKKIDARANISSISDSTSLIATDFLCPEISFLHDRRGITFDYPLRPPVKAAISTNLFLK